MTDFVHLHNHSEYSLLDGANRVEDLVRLAVEHEMPALALTDHGVMHGAVEFYTRCTEAGVKPIIGSEVYTSGDRPRTGRDPRLDKENFHLLLLAQNETGYRNLVKLVSRASLEGFYYKPRVDHEILAQHSDGLICTCACLGGEVQQALMAGQEDRALAIAGKYRDIFGPERYFIELQSHGQPEEVRVNEGLLRIARELDLEIVATNDIHYGSRADADPHDVLLCIGTGSRQADTDRLRYPTDEFYFKSLEEMRGLFPDHPKAISNTLRIAEMVDFQMALGDMILPHFKTPEGHTYDSWFEACCWEGAKRRYPDLTEARRQRIEYEMDVIKAKGYAAYFLIVADFVRYAHERGIPARCRGSAAGSVVSYLLGITNVDPLKYGLLFERFLYMERLTPPDIDLDFADYRREEVIQYCRDEYGPDHVAQIITFGTLGARAAIRDVSRALDVPLAEADRLARLIPTHQGKAPPISRCIEDVPELKARYQEEPEVRRVMDAARAIEGLSRHASVHAAAVVITPGPVTDYAPVQRSDTGLITQYDMNWISALGLLKMDFLGLRTLTVVEHCVRLMREDHPDEVPADFNIDEIPIDDPRVFQLLQKGATAGIFQLESQGMRNLVMDIRPERFEDLIPLVALYRPGPLGNGDTERFIKRRHGLEKVQYLDACLKDILAPTYGIFVYQEQILKVAMQVAGMGPKDADTVLRAMSKKKMDKMLEARPQFLLGAKRVSRLTEARAARIFDAMASFASYGFNQSHSCAYAVLTYQTAWLKANFPTEFMAALLTSIAESKEKVVAYIDECRTMEPPILVKPPDVNRSVSDFSVDRSDPDGHTIRFGLCAIKGVGEGPVNAILAARNEGGPFRDIHDFCERIDISQCQRSTVEAIIKAGGFDAMHANRHAAVAALDDAFAAAQRARREKESGQVALFDALFDGGEAARPPRPLPDVPDYPRPERLAQEKELLGLYLSGHPFLAYRERAARYGPISTAELKSMADREDVVVAGIVAGMRRVVTRSSQAEMCIVSLEDMQGKVAVTIFPRAWEQYRSQVEMDKAIVVRGKTSHRDRVRGTEDGEATEVEVLAEEILALNGEEERPFGLTPVLNSPANGNRRTAPEAARAYHSLHVDISGAAPDALEVLISRLSHYPGDCPVIVDNRGQRIESALRVRATEEVRREAASVLGEAAAWLE